MKKILALILTALLLLSSVAFAESAQKPVVLVVSFGTSFNDSRDATIGAIEAALQEAYPDYEVRRAFTSQIIIDKLKERDGLEIDNVTEAMERLTADGVKSVVIQPTHVMNGFEYDDVVKEVTGYADKFDSFKLGTTLLANDADYDTLAKVLADETKAYNTEDTAIVFMGHGTEHAANATYTKMQEKLSSAGFANYFVGTVEATPSLEDVLAQVKAIDARKVVLTPLMIVAGDHANNDMAGDEADSWKSQFTAAGFEVECLIQGLGQLEGVRQMIVDHVAATLAENTASTAEATAPGSDSAAAASAQPADGTYAITVSSSSSMFRIVNAQLTVKDGAMTAVITLSGKGYGKVFMGTGEEAAAIGTDAGIPYVEDANGAYTYQVPVAALDQELDCAAWSMKKEKWYDRTLVFESSTIAPYSAENAASQSKQAAEADQPAAQEKDWRAAAKDLGNGWQAEGETALAYAEQFALYAYQDGFQLLALANGSRYLIIPEGQSAPENLASDVVTLTRPVGNIYLAATASASLLEAIGSLDSITLTSTQASGWYNDNIRAAVEAGRIGYVGKYSAPDYELILQSGCSLAVESLMITHAPEVSEKFEELGIPVLVDLSSQEPHPLGRTEWLKAYAALTGKESEAERLFQEQEAYLQSAMQDTGKTVAFFYINTDGNAVVRKPKDYISKMIKLAGGKYVFENLDEAVSSTAMDMEQFYASAKDADIVIYNSAIAGELNGLDDFLSKSPLLADFKAVQTGNLWCTAQSMYQETMQLGKMTSEMHKLFAGEADDDLVYLYRLH